MALMGSAAALAFAPSIALAQQTGSTTVANSDAVNVGEVVVTATKRAEPVKKVADAVSVLSTQQLRTAGVKELRDLNGLVPGLTVGGALSSGEFIIRGLTNGGDSTPITGLQIDGAPIGAVAYGAATASQMPQLDPSLFSRIEVLKGPQGTLYGGSTLGGIVQFVTKKPSLEAIEGDFTVEGSSTDHGGGNYVVSGGVDGPIVKDQLGFSLSAYDNDLSGFIDDPKLGRNDFNYHHSYGGRVALLWQVSPDFQIELADLYSHLKSYTDLVPYDATTHQPLMSDLEYDEGTLPLSESNFNLVSLNATYDLHWSTLSFIGTYQKFHNSVTAAYDDSPLTTIVEDLLPSFGGVPIPPTSEVGAYVNIDTSKWTSELRLASPDSGRLRWLAGAFFNHEQSETPETVGIVEPDQTSAPAPLGSLLHFDGFTHLTEVAGFGDLTYYILPNLDLTGGIRVGHISKDYRLLSSGSDFAALNLLDTIFGLSATPADTGVVTASQTFETYLASLRYHLSANSMVYFRFATGFRPGGPNDLVPGIPQTYSPDTTRDYELGWKTDFWGRRGYLDLSVYRIDWDNIQIPITVDGLTGLTNGGAARSEGVEGAVTVTPLSGLTMTGSGAYNDAHLTETIPGGLGDSGDTMPNAPKWSGMLGASYQLSLQGGWLPYVSVQLRYVGSRDSAFAHSTNTPDYVMPAYTMIDLQVGVRYGRYDLQLFARNVGDVRAQLGDGYEGANFVAVSRPRTLGASLHVNF